MAEVSHAKPVHAQPQQNMCRKKDRARYGSGNNSTFQRRQNKPDRNYYKGVQQNNITEKHTSRPTFMRLDSTGENSAESTEDLSSYHPGKSKQNACGWNFWNTCDTNVGTGLLGKVKSAFIRPQNNRGFVRSNLASSDRDSSNSKLVDLDSVAQKFIPASAMPTSSTMMDNPQKRRCTNGWNPFPSCPSPSRNFSQGRVQSQFFHPYHQNYQGNFIQSTMAYRQPTYQPWQRVYGNVNHSRACYPPPLLSGYGYCNRPMMWDRHPFQHLPPPYPGPQEFRRHWQGQVGGLMMQGPGNFGQMTHNQRWTQRPKLHHNTRKSTKSYRHRNQNRTCQQKLTSVESSSSKEAVSEIPEACVESSATDHVPSTDLNAAVVGDGTKDTPPEKACAESAASCVNSISTTLDSCSPKLQVEISIKNDVNAQKTDDTKVQECDATNVDLPECMQHSSIAHILADYNARVSVDDGSISTDSDFSDAGCETTTDGNSDLWNIFTVADDPYNPLCGWRCEENVNQCGLPSRKTQMGEGTVSTDDADSGTDEGDEWSQSDDDVDCDSDDDGEEDEASQRIDNLEIDNTKLSKIQIPLPSARQYDQACDNNSDNKPNNGGISPIHPSVAFILGSYADSTDDESDDDNDWDCDDESTSLLSNPLWDSFNKSSDPYSPLEAWKLGGSSLLSPNRQHTSPCTIHVEIQKRETAFKHAQSMSYQTKSPADTTDGGPYTDRHQRGLSSSPTSGKAETIDTNCDEFSIDEVRVHVSRDDHSVETPPSSGSMKRVASASCLRKLQLTPELKALKKVRFCPKSSFIVLVDKQQKHEEDELLSKKNDWQACARDRHRFRARIARVEEALTPILLPSHREQVFQTRFSVNDKS